jgi:LmbE family N-acetylglucosaminyl deacetylase
MSESVFLAAHLDDAVYSCGGLIHQQVQSGRACTVLTAFAGDPPDGGLSDFARALHRLWKTPDAPVAERRDEDLDACGVLGAAALHVGLPEALYRVGGDGVPLYPSEEAIFGPPDPGDQPIVPALTAALSEVGLERARVYAPLAIGGHVDHRILRLAAEALGQPLWYYSDLPYAMRGGELPQGLRRPKGVESVLPLDADDLSAWADAAACYRSQASTFWDDPESMADELEDYVAGGGGLHILAPA